MWALVMFDLPVMTKKQRNAANGYRHMLQDDGFIRIQLSVYAKYFINGTGLVATAGRLKTNLPPGGLVRLLKLTDAQWLKTVRIEHVVGGDPKPEEPPPALLLF